MYFEAVVVFALFSTGEAVSCYDCLSSSETECLSKQKSVECGTGSCMTFKYLEKRGKSTKYIYEKGCSKSYERCQSHCASNLPKIIKDCEVLVCCHGNHCNEKIKVNQKRSAHRSRGQSIYKDSYVSLFAASSIIATFGYQVLYKEFL